MRKKIPLSRIRDAAAGDRPKLFAWMIANHDSFLAELKKAVCPDWESLASMFNAEGRTNAHGHPVTAITAERAWRKARKTIEERRVVKPKRLLGRAKQPAAGMVRQVLPAPQQMPAAPADHGDDEGPIIEPSSRFNLKPPVFRNERKKEI